VLCVVEQIASILLHFIFGFVDGAYGWDDFGCSVFFFLWGGEGEGVGQVWRRRRASSRMACRFSNSATS
jgi:hypothetical protein